MQCMFLRREYPEPVVLPTLSEILSDLTVDEIYGKNSTSSGYTSGISALSDGSRQYIAIFCNGYCTIWKVELSGGTYTYTVLASTSNGVGIYRRTTDSKHYINKSNGNAVTGTYQGSSLYGGTIARISFPSYTDAEVDNVLKAASMERVAGYEGSGNSYVRTQNKSHAFIFAAKTALLDVWTGDTWTWITGTATKAASVSGGYLTLGTGRASLVAID